MATTTLDPNADVVGNWTEVGGPTTNFECLDDAVRDPTDPQTSGDGDLLNGTTTAGTECEVGLGTFTLGTDEVSAARLKFWALTNAKRGINYRLLTGSTELAAGSLGANQGAQWRTLTYTGSLTQAEIDDLRAEFVVTTTAGGGGAGAPGLYAVYVEVDHSSVTALTPGQLVHTRDIYAPEVNVTLLPGQVVHTRDIFAPQLNVVLEPGQLTHTRDIYAPTIGSGTSLGAGFLTHTRTIDAPQVNVSVLPGQVNHDRQVFTPTTASTVFPPNLTHARDIYTPTIPGGGGGDGWDLLVQRPERPVIPGDL